MGFLVLLLRLFELHLVDLDTVTGRFEAEVDRERVGIVDFFAFWMLGERAKLGTGERL